MKYLSPKLKSKFAAVWQKLEPYKDVIIFVIALFVSNGIWKLCVHGDEDNIAVTLLGLDVTAFFQWCSEITAEAVFWVVSLFRDTVHLINGHYIRFDSGAGTIVVWSCSGLKQMFIWMCLILTVPGTSNIKHQTSNNHSLWLHKLWFIPFGWLVCYAFNILRISLIALLIEFHPAWFPFLHEWLFKYLFYAMLFGLWVIFVEKIKDSALSH